MKRDEVRAAAPNLTDAELDAIMALHGNDVAANKTRLDSLTAQRDDYKARMEEANGKLTGYDPEWSTKVQQAEQNAAAKVAAIEANYAAERAVSGVSFSSDSAKRAFLADLSAKKLPVQDGKLLGFDDFLTAYKQTDAAAFSAPAPSLRAGGHADGKPAESTANEQINAAFRALIH